MEGHSAQSRRASQRIGLITAIAALSVVAGCNSDDDDMGTDGPANAGTPAAHTLGNATAGRDVFLFETFGNERFWTDAARLPQGMVAAGVTPLQALQIGLSVDVERLSASMRAQVAADLAADRTGASSALLNNPATTVALINANAVIGFSAKDTNGDGVINISNGDKVGATCAACHAVTDGSVFGTRDGGSIGQRLDGLANHKLDFGGLIALASNSRAFYPILQLNLAANGNTTLGRITTGLTETSTEAQVDAFLRNKAAYPVGMFDDTFDGNGDPMHNSALFAQGLAGPYGTEGTFDKQDDFANTVYTGLLDPTGITTASGRAFLNKLGGPAGDEIVTDYISILTATGVTGYPFVQATPPTDPTQIGGLAYPLGVRVNQTKLNDLNAFVFSLAAPAGVRTDTAAIQRGRTVFRTQGCTACHNVDQTIPVPTFIVRMSQIFPGDMPVTLATRMAPLNPVLNTVSSIFDDKMAVVNASIRGGLERGTALPLLLDLARKPVFLHDNSVPTLDNLFDAARGTSAPHPFFVSGGDRADLIAFLQSRDAMP